MKFWAAIVTIVIAGQASALEPLPLSPEQVACSSAEYAFSGHVVDAHSYACRKLTPDCWPYYAGATVVVEEVVAPSRGGLHVGDTVHVAFGVSQLPSYVNAEDLQHNGSIVLADNHADEITDDFVKSQIVGKSFFFAADLAHRFLLGGISARVSEQYRAEVYPASDIEWFRTMWMSPDCRSDQKKAKIVRHRLGLDGKQ